MFSPPCNYSSFVSASTLTYKLAAASDLVSDKSDSLKVTNHVPWYKIDIGPRLKPPTRDLFKNYSQIPDDEIISHLHAIRDRAWPLGEYPCVGEWLFLLPSVLANPHYGTALQRVKAGATILDLGCCFGQDLRRLAADGAPTERMYASDLSGKLWELGFELFRDRGRMKAQFFEADILKTDPTGSSLSQDLELKIDIFFLCQFLHLFSWDKQVDALKAVVRMARTNALLIGYQIGRVNAEEVPRPWGTMFFHNVQSFESLWQLVGKETGTRWEADAELVILSAWGMELEDYEWMAETSRGLNFMVRRVDQNGNP